MLNCKNSISIATTVALLATPTTVLADTWVFTLTNHMVDEHIAELLLTDAGQDHKIFVEDYISPEAETLVLTGDPRPLAAAIGAGASIGEGNDTISGYTGQTNPAGTSTFEVELDATSVRVMSMIGTEVVPDNYVGGLLDLSIADSGSIALNRYDIGHDEKTGKIINVGSSVATLSFVRKEQ